MKNKTTANLLKYLLVSTTLLVNTLPALADAAPTTNTATKGFYTGFSVSHSLNTSAKSLEKPNGFKSELPNADIFIGKTMNDNYRLEASAGYRSFNYKNSFNLPATFTDEGDPRSLASTNNDKYKVSLYKVMINAYYDIVSVHDKFTPYVMAGVGAAHINHTNFVQNSYFSDGTSESTNLSVASKFNPAYQLGFGVDMKLTKNMSADLGFRHANYGKIKLIGDDTQFKLKSNEVLLGLKYHF